MKSSKFRMQTWALPLAALLFLAALSACGSQDNSPNGASSPSASPSAGESASPTADSSERITYQSESGPVEVPANPQRVVVLSTYAGDVLSLGVPLVGADSWSKSNPNFQERLKDVAEVSDENLERIVELQPDLIIGSSDSKNLDKLKQIAPTVVFTYGKVDYLTQHAEIGKVVNKEKEARAWVDDFKRRAADLGARIKAKIGDAATVSVIENYEKQIYVFGDNWGRGTEILYQAMGLKMPGKVAEMTKKDGYYDLSAEVLPEYMGDYVVFSKDSAADSSFQQTELYKNTPAAKNGRVFETDAKAFYFNDALSLDYQLNFLEEKFLGN